MAVNGQVTVQPRYGARDQFVGIKVSEIDRLLVEEVIVYAKLPRGFMIPTPGGSYNPDWAIALEFAGERQIYFVAETKADTSTEQLRLAELQSTGSAERYFRDVSPEVQFKKIEGYDELLEAIG